MGASPIERRVSTVVSHGEEARKEKSGNDSLDWAQALLDRDVKEDQLVARILLHILYYIDRFLLKWYIYSIAIYFIFKIISIYIYTTYTLYNMKQHRCSG